MNEKPIENPIDEKIRKYPTARITINRATQLDIFLFHVTHYRLPVQFLSADANGTLYQKNAKKNPTTSSFSKDKQIASQIIEILYHFINGHIFNEETKSRLIFEEKHFFTFSLRFADPCAFCVRAYAYDSVSPFSFSLPI